MIDVELESRELAERSRALTGMLDGGHPVLGPPPAELDESRRLGRAAHEARQRVAERVARGQDPGCPLGPPAPIRRVKTDPRTGADLDPLRGRQAVTDELLQFWTYRRDCVADVVAGWYNRAATETPFSEALTCAARGHLALLQGRQSSGEGAAELGRALKAYNDAYDALRQAALDSQMIGNEAVGRLASLRRIVAQLEVGDDDLKPLIAAAAAREDAPLIDPESGRPLEAVYATTGRPVNVTATAGSGPYAGPARTTSR
jgi:hypothetical protein